MTWFLFKTTKGKLTLTIIALVVGLQILNFTLFFPMVRSAEKDVAKSNQMLELLQLENRYHELLDRYVRMIRYEFSNNISDAFERLDSEFSRDVFLSDLSYRLESQSLPLKELLLIEGFYVAPYSSEVVDLLSLSVIDKLMKSPSYSVVYIKDEEDPTNLKYLGFPVHGPDQKSLLVTFEVNRVLRELSGILGVSFEELNLEMNPATELPLISMHRANSRDSLDTIFLNSRLIFIAVFSASLVLFLWFLISQRTLAPFRKLIGRLRETGLIEKTQRAIELDELDAVRNLFQKVIDESQSDGLTQLKNRKYFNQFLESLFRQGQCQFSLILIDLDHFKSINDRFGHPAGDYVLREVAEIIRNEIRKTDMAFRYGGEELGVLTLGSSLSQAKDLAERIRRSIELHRFFYEGKYIEVTASFGIASSQSTWSRRQELDLNSLMLNLISYADQALYYSKSAGRNQATVYSKGDQKSVIQDLVQVPGAATTSGAVVVG